jgi:aminoglycoside phosphotransferase (APT) family kinase protein
VTSQSPPRPGPPRDLERVLAAACEEAGFPASRVRLLRHFANAVYLLEDVPVVARVAYGPGDGDRSAKAVAITAWLAAQGMPVTEPAAMPNGSRQPVTMCGAAVTFWRYYPQPTPPCRQDPMVLASIARALHAVTADPPVLLPDYQPLRSVSGALDGARVAGALDDARLGWLARRVGELRTAYRRLSFPLGCGLIHGDLHTGNLLRDGERDGGQGVVLGDWDSVCIGPREIDLVPMFAAPRFGVESAAVDRFAAAYGHDLRTWSGFRTLREIRDVSTLTVLLRLAAVDSEAATELYRRIDSLRRGETTVVWTPW